MKEETKQQAPAIGAIILAIITAVTTTAQYCKTAEETRQIEATQIRSTEAIIVGLSKEISDLQEDVDDLYRNTERLQITLEVYRSGGAMFGVPVSGIVRPESFDDGHDSDADGVPDFLDHGEVVEPVEPLGHQRAEPSSPSDIRQRIYDMMDEPKK